MTSVQYGDDPGGRVVIADLCVAVSANRGVNHAVDLLFGGCLAAGDRPPDVVIELRGEPPPRPGRRPDVAFDDHVELWFEADGLVVFDRLGVGAVARADRIVAGGDGDDRSWRLAVQYALVASFARRGRHAVHGAGLGRDGAVVLALGAGGAGKSTLSYAAHRRGWHVQSDDLTWLYEKPEEPDTVRAAGFAKPLAVPGELVDEAPLGATRAEDDERGRWLLPVDAAAGGVGLPVVGLLEVAHSRGAARLVPFPAGPVALAGILRSHPLVADPAVARAFFPLAARIARLPCWQLEHDVDPARRVERAGELLDEAFARFVAGTRQ